ncbi:uncharacterized protein LOC131317310 [Rhododendron vialii]|uniref:uncharacterized protein LOC131317310 n=1 Tax=Rhododendron vialii TaxID=182163 RepID=UPI00265EC596|nr:uncharacterized protein LOC131317310 [Rhododendron vialii]
MGKNLHNFQLLDLLTSDSIRKPMPKEVQDEMNFPISEDDLRSPSLLNAEQTTAYNEILNVVLNQRPKSFFIDGPEDGDGKLCCGISKQSGLATLMKKAALIIYDKASMAKKESIEALDSLLHDLTENDTLFGGKVVVLGGDFRQVLPIIPKRTKIQCINASLVRSYIWQSLIKFKLKENMRAKTDLAFGAYILRVGNDQEKENEVGEIKLPSSLILQLTTRTPPLDQLIQFVFPLWFWRTSFYAILTPKNLVIDEINEAMIARFPGEE